MTFLLPRTFRLNRIQSILLAYCLSLSFWAVLLAWLHQFRIPLGPVSSGSILVSGWVLGWFLRRKLRQSTARTAIQPAQIALGALFLLLAGAGLWTLKDIVVGTGSDSYHHTLITQIISERGLVPDDFKPYAPIESFSYHFGFHGFTALLVWLTGCPPVVLVPILGALISALAVLGVGFFAQITTRSPTAAVASVAVAGLLSIFPFFMINWGRFTQLTGLLVLSVLLGMAWCWLESGAVMAAVPMIALLATGLALSHYRVTLMAAAGIAVMAVLSLWSPGRRPTWQVCKDLAARLSCCALGAMILGAPWLWHLLRHRSRGFPVIEGRGGASFFQLGRLGPFVLHYPTNWLVLALAGTALILGCWKRDRLVLALTAWCLLLYALSLPARTGMYLDTISLVASSYLPLAILIGWGIAIVFEALAARWKAVVWAGWIGLAGASLWGAYSIGTMITAPAAYVQQEDLPAMDWIRNNIPPSARFMVNTYHWDFFPEWVVGADSGYWVPLLAGRETVTMPMLYSGERVSSPDIPARLTALDRMASRLPTPEGLRLLARERISHVFLGKRGGPISAAELQSSAHFKQLYDRDGVYVFQFIP